MININDILTKDLLKQMLDDKFIDAYIDYIFR